MSQVDGEVVSKHTSESVMDRTRDMVLSIVGVVAGDPPVLSDEEINRCVGNQFQIANISRDFQVAFCMGLVEALKIIHRTREGERISALAAGQPDTSSDEIKNTRLDIISWLDTGEQQTVDLMLKSFMKYKDWIKNGRNPETGINISLNFQALELLCKMHGGMVQAVFDAGLKATGVRQDLLPTWTANNGS